MGTWPNKAKTWKISNASLSDSSSNKAESARKASAALIHLLHERAVLGAAMRTGHEGARCYVLLRLGHRSPPSWTLRSSPKDPVLARWLMATAYRAFRLRSSPIPTGRCCREARATTRLSSSPGLRSSPAPKGRCCLAREWELGAHVDVAILTGPEGPVLRFLNWDVTRQRR